MLCGSLDQITEKSWTQSLSAPGVATPATVAAASLSQNSRLACGIGTAAWAAHSAPTQSTAMRFEASPQQPRSTRLPHSQSFTAHTKLLQPATATAAVDRRSARTAANSPTAIIARQKARYARAYVAPLALRQSQLRTTAAALTETETQATRGASQQTHIFPALLSQPNTSSAPLLGGRSNASRCQSQSQRATQPLADWPQLLCTTQERQLAQWKQLTQTQQQLIFEVHGLCEEVRCIRQSLAENLTLLSQKVAAASVTAKDAHVDAASSSVHKRHRAQHTESGSRPDKEGRQVKGCTSSRRLMTVHSIRLIGSSTTSTQAFPPEEANPAAESTDAAQAEVAHSQTGNAAPYNNASDAADSEADLFLL